MKAVYTTQLDDMLVLPHMLAPARDRLHLAGRVDRSSFTKAVKELLTHAITLFLTYVGFIRMLIL